MLLLERFEERLAPVATPAQIAAALDLPAGVIPTVTGDALSANIASKTGTANLLGFPTKKDNAEFLVLSTGNAANIEGPNSAGNQGTDLGATGVTGDTATVSFSLNVPSTSIEQRLKVDFLFMSEEFPEYIGSTFNDFFTFTVNGTNIALDQLGNPISVNNVFVTNEPATGTFFDGRTFSLTGTYKVPANTTTLDIVMSIGDVGDGIYDSAALVDNVRLEDQQVVFLDFGGGNVGNFFKPNSVTTIPVFDPADLNFTNQTTAQIAASIQTGLETLYQAYDIKFTTVKPATGPYMRVLFGGTLDAPVTSNSDPLTTGTLGATPDLRDLLGLPITGEMFGSSQGSMPDIGNKNKNDLAVILTKDFVDYYRTLQNEPDLNLKAVIVTAAHEIAHNLGARHHADSVATSVMKQLPPIAASSTFENQTRPLAENVWADHATTENTHEYLLSVLGPKIAGSQLAKGFSVNALTKTVKLNAGGLPSTIYNVTIGIKGPTGGGNSGTEGDAISPTIIQSPGGTSTITFTIPNVYEDPEFYFTASTTPNGPINVFSGQQSGGNLSPTQSTLKLFTAPGVLNQNIPVSIGTPGSLTSGGSVSLSETGLTANIAPVNTVPGSQSTQPNTNLVFSQANGNAILISDSDAGAAPIQLGLSVTNGTLSLSQTTGLTFISGDGTTDSAMTFSGTVSDIRAALNGLTFLPNNGFSGGAVLSIVTNDLGNSGTGGPQSDTDTIDITVGNIVSGPLNITGTGNADVININPNGSSTTQVVVTVNGVSLGVFQPSGLITVSGGAGNDSITVGAGVTIGASITGGDGNDTIVGGAGNDTVFGGLGNDLLFGVNGNDLLFGEAGNDSFDGGIGNDTMDGADGDDFLFGQAGADSLIGGTGNDGINGGADNDTVLGQAGIDYIEGGDGADSLIGGDDQDGFDAGAGNDFVDGGLGNDFMYGFAGNDTLLGQSGNDGIDAGDGNDSVDAGLGDDFMYGLGGNDTLLGNDGNDGIDGGLGDDFMSGGNGNDLLFGAAGNDSLDGGAGNDSLDGNAGNDTMDGSSENDLIFASGGGIDILRGGTGNDTLQNIDSTATIFGGAGNDILYGANFTNDSLLGEDGNDAIFGLSGNDTITTGAGSDTADGGAGTDLVIDPTGDILLNIP